MKSLVRVGLCAVVLTACAPARSAPPTPAPTPAEARPDSATPASPPAVESSLPPTPSAPAAPLIREAPRNWQLLDGASDGVPGTGSERALRELLAQRRPRRTVLVAVIDGGVDTAHVDLRGNLWTNANEVPGNAKDDDGNGYTDDVHGWNFIGGRDGRDVRYDTFEVTRQHVRCTGGSHGTTPAPTAGDCQRIAGSIRRSARKRR
jgi:subtilisin family serine protease